MVAVASAGCRRARRWLVATLSVVLLAGGCSSKAETAGRRRSRRVCPSASASGDAPSMSASPSATTTPRQHRYRPAGATPKGPQRPTSSRPVPPERPAVAPTRTATASDRVSVSSAGSRRSRASPMRRGRSPVPRCASLSVWSNNGSTPLDLGLVAVNAYIGKDRVPAGTVTKPGGKPFTGELARGSVGRGRLPLRRADRTNEDDVTVTVDYRADAPTAVFRGPMP